MGLSHTAHSQVKQIKSGSAEEEEEAAAQAVREAALLLLREGARASNARGSAFPAEARLRQVGR